MFESLTCREEASLQLQLSLREAAPSLKRLRAAGALASWP